MLAALLLALIPTQEPYSVVVVVLDDVAAADVSTYGGPVPTPFLSLAAANGVRFDRAYANPTCSPSRRGLQYGHWWTAESGGQCPPAIGPNTPLPTDVSLAEALPNHSSAFIGKWHLGALGGYCAPALEGYDYSLYVTPSNPRECGGSSYTHWMATTPSCTLAVRTDYGPRTMRDAFVSGWPMAPDPSLTILSLNLAHGPFHVPPPDMLPAGYVVGSTQRERYEAMIVAADRIVGAVLATIDPLRTVVIIVGDNGTPPQVAPDPLRAKTTTFERGVRVPFVIVGGPTQPGVVSDALVHIADVFVTAIELGAEPLPTGTPHPIASVSLVPILDGSGPAGHDMILLGHGRGTDSSDAAVVSMAGLKLRMLDTNGDLVTDSEEAYDLVLDPGETQNVINAPDRAADLAAMRAWFAGAVLP